MKPWAWRESWERVRLQICRIRWPGKSNGRRGTQGMCRAGKRFRAYLPYKQVHFVLGKGRWVMRLLFEGADGLSSFVVVVHQVGPFYVARMRLAAGPC